MRPSLLHASLVAASPLGRPLVLVPSGTGAPLTIGVCIRHLRYQVLAAGLIWFVAVGCATTPRADGPRRAASRFSAIDPSASPATVVTGADLLRFTGLTLPEALLRIRPAFFEPRRHTRTRPDASPPVYLNGMFLGDLSALSSIPVDGVREVRRLSRADLMVRFGRGDAAVGYLVTAR